MGKGLLLRKLIFLIEQNLYEELRFITERPGISQEEIEKEQQKAIINFINRYKTKYNFDNIEDIIVNTLNQEIGIKVSWVEKRIQEKQPRKKNNMKGNVREGKTTNQEKSQEEI